MNPRQPFERLEQRRLLSASFRGAVDSAVADRYADIAVEQVRQALPEASLAVSSSFARASDLDLYEPAELTQARQWVFIGEGDVAGATVEPSGVIDGVSIATFNNPANAMAALEASGSEAFYPLEARQQSRRAIPNDTRFNDQWHLRNTGQSGGLVGADANITDVWDTYRGAGVTIGIVDDGLHFDHPDLAPQYVAADSFDFNDNDSIPFASSPGDFHGTSVAGIAAARGFDGAGVTGAAPEANLSGLRLISGPSNDSQEAGALSFNNQSIDIYSNSWGPFDDGRRIEGPGPLTLAAIEQTATEGRDGLGGIITWAGGNGGDGDDSNRDGYANSRHTISVAAVNNFGVRSSYSEPGANHLVTAYSSGGSRGTTTTDGSNGFTNSFGGTSSATPLVSGVIAPHAGSQSRPDAARRPAHPRRVGRDHRPERLVLADQRCRSRRQRLLRPRCHRRRGRGQSGA
ncbi:MAG: S8 family serine peptidase [Planctomycetota bacterium]